MHTCIVLPGIEIDIIGVLMNKDCLYLAKLISNHSQLISIIKVAKKRGAQVVRDIWEESDEHGIVRMATLKTVSIISSDLWKILNILRNCFN